MSYDELPPDAQTLQSEDADATPAPQDPSSQDAPPVAPTSRRRKRTAGPDAASQTETTPTTPPARTTRRRTAVAAADTSPDLPGAISSAADTADVAETGQAEPSAEPQTKPTRRRSARTAPPAAAAETPVQPEQPPLSDESASAAAQPPKAARRTRRTPATQESPPAEAPAAEAEVPPADAAEKPKRSRARQAKTEAPTPPDAVAAAPAEVTAAETEPTADSAALPDTEPKARGRRQSKGSRRQPAAPITRPVDTEPEAMPDGVPDAQQTVPVSGEALPKPAEAADSDGEATAESDADGGADQQAQETGRESAEKRKRSNRRGRNRRGAKEAAPVGEAVATEALPALVEEPPTPVIVEPPIDLNVGAHLVVRNRRPILLIDGASHPPTLFFGNLEGMKNRQRVLSEVRRAARAGVHLHSVLVELPCPLSESGEALDEIDARIRAILDADPDGYVMPRVVFLPARGWKREYPTEISAYPDGSTGDPSLTSARFWQECERSLDALISHITKQIWGNRVFGYHLERGEWFQPADPGFDRSMANRDAFRDWLRAKYQDDLVALRAAWYDGDVQFHTAEIPTPPAKPNPQRAFYETRRERSLIDFNAFTSETTAQRLISLARAVKKATANNALVSVCYGYTFEFGHAYNGHLALDMLLDEKGIDLICGPPSYRDRKPGGAASLPAPVESLLLHGKLWLSEDDTKTYLAPAQQDPEDFNPRLGDRQQTEQAQARAMGRTMATQTGIGWMDLWGEGWLDEDAMWERIGVFAARLKAQQEQPQPVPTPDVVVLIDEKSLLHIQKGEPFFRRLTNGLRDTVQRAGISYGAYLQSDILHPDFPTDARLYLFLTPYRLPVEQRTAIKEKLQGGGRTLVWLYAPGSCEARPGLGGVMEETSTGATGLMLRQQAWNSEIGSRVLVPNHPLTEKLGGRDIGARERLNPSFYVDDPSATVLAEYHGSGLASMAVKDNGGWKSVFVGDPVLPLELLRGICRYAGVHLWTGGGEDVTSVGNGWVMVHASRDGQRTLRLPAPAALYDVTERRLIADEVRDYRYFLRAGNTRLFYYGTVEAMRALDLPNLPEAGVGRAPVILAENAYIEQPETSDKVERVDRTDRVERVEQTEKIEHIEPVMKVEKVVPLPPSVSPTLNTDLETLKAVLSMEMPEIDDYEIEEPDDDIDITIVNMDVAPATATLAQVLGAEVGGNSRRRRRRGGRGRGRRREADALPAPATIDAGIVPPILDDGLLPPPPPEVDPFHEMPIFDPGDAE